MTSLGVKMRIAYLLNNLLSNRKQKKMIQLNEYGLKIIGFQRYCWLKIDQRIVKIRWYWFIIVRENNPCNRESMKFWNGKDTKVCEKFQKRFIIDESSAN